MSNALGSRQNTDKPLVSVVLPVYNGGGYLSEAVSSILAQTYHNFEFIIINDGSTDNSAEIVKSFNDPRIRYYDQTNRGLSATLNRGVELSRGQYIARQDADDISLPNRFERQVAFLENNPNCGLVGTWAAIWEESNPSQRTHKHPVESSILKFELLFDNPFVHSSVMIRKKVFEEVGFYTTIKERLPEDYELWSRIARHYEISNIPEILQVYREIKGSICRTGVNPFLDRVINLSFENIEFLLGSKFLREDVIDLTSFFHHAYHRISNNLSFKRMSEILYRAAGEICKQDNLPEEKLNKRVEEILYFVRRNYLRYRYGRYFGRAIYELEKAVGRSLMQKQSGGNKK